MATQNNKAQRQVGTPCSPSPLASITTSKASIPGLLLTPVVPPADPVGLQHLPWCPPHDQGGSSTDVPIQKSNTNPTNPSPTRRCQPTSYSYHSESCHEWVMLPAIDATIICYTGSIVTTRIASMRRTFMLVIHAIARCHARIKDVSYTLGGFRKTTF